VGRFDFVWPDQAVMVMMDRTDATTDVQLQRLRDLRKQEDLMRMQGYIVLTVTTHELIHQARAVVARINVALTRAAA
jgi:very-short-patch-repair endonuclease